MKPRRYYDSCACGARKLKEAACCRRCYMATRKYLLPEKACTRCGRTLPIGQFRIYGHAGYRRAACVACEYAAHRRRLARDPVARQRAQRRRSTRSACRRLGVPAEVLERFLVHVMEARNCEICGRTDARLELEHDHVTGVMRGLTCHSCNTGLARFHDDPALLREAAAYLEARAGLSALAVCTNIMRLDRAARGLAQQRRSASVDG